MPTASSSATRAQSATSSATPATRPGNAAVAPPLDAHRTLLEWTGLLSRAPHGCVLVCQPNDSAFAHVGKLSAETLTDQGVRGYVVDGGCRDTGFILRTGFRV